MNQMTNWLNATGKQGRIDSSLLSIEIVMSSRHKYLVVSHKLIFGKAVKLFFKRNAIVQ